MCLPKQKPSGWRCLWQRARSSRTWYFKVFRFSDRPCTSQLFPPFLTETWSGTKFFITFNQKLLRWDQIFFNQSFYKRKCNLNREEFEKKRSVFVVLMQLIWSGYNGYKRMTITILFCCLWFTGERYKRKKETKKRNISMLSLKGVTLHRRNLSMKERQREGEQIRESLNGDQLGHSRSKFSVSFVEFHLLSSFVKFSLCKFE